MQRHAITQGIGLTDDVIKNILLVLPKIDAVVLREKQLTLNELAIGIEKLLAFGAPSQKIIVHSYPQLAARYNLYGCHFASHVTIAFNVFSFICGQSTHSLEEALASEARGANYVYFSHIFPTRSKSNLQPKGIDALRDVCKHITIPVIALGGITNENVHRISSAGAKGFAAISMYFTNEES